MRCLGHSEGARLQRFDVQYSSMLLVSLRLGKQKWSAKEVCGSLFWLLDEIVGWGVPHIGPRATSCAVCVWLLLTSEAACPLMSGL